MNYLGEDAERPAEPQALNAAQARAAFTGFPLMLTQTQEPQPSPRVILAFSFIKHCNEHMGPKNHVMGDAVHGMRGKVIRHSLNVQQEKVFNLACQALGEYFAGKEV